MIVTIASRDGNVRRPGTTAGRAKAASWLATLGFVAALVCLAPVATAVNRYWIDDSGQWDVSGNWSPSGQPQEGDDAYLTQSDATDRTVTYYNTANPTAVLDYLRIDATGDGTMTLNMPNDHALLVSVEYVGFDGRGAITQSAGTHAAGMLVLGDSAASSGTYTMAGGTLVSNLPYVGRKGAGTLTIEAGGEVYAFEAYLGYWSGSTGTVKVTGAGSTWANSVSLYVGERGAGTLTIEAGGEVDALDAYLGYKSGSTGTAMVTGAGSTWTNSGTLYVGYGGAGTLTVTDGGLVNARTLSASPSDLLGNGTITAHGAVLDADLVFDSTHGLTQTLAFGTGGTLNLNVDGTGHLGVGHKAAGMLRIADGLSVASSYGWLGYGSGSTGTAMVTGPGSTWTNPGTLYVGYGGAGWLTIEAGGQVSNTYGYLGNSAGSTGTATVTGADSTWTNSRSLGVGREGAGTLTVGAGGQVSDRSGYLGTGAGSSGTATVTGAGSTWTNSGGLTVGRDGTGTLTIEAGGQVSNSFGCLGERSGSTGTAAVTGTGSTWTNSGSLYVGGSNVAGGGTGSVTIQDGGELLVADTLTLWKADSEVTVNAGTLTAGVLEGTAGSVRITDPGGGTALAVGSADSGTFAGTLLDDTNPGSLTKTGSGTQVLAGPSIAYTGTTTVLDGILRLSDTTAFASDILNGATTEFEVTAGTWTFDEAIGGAGTFVKSGAGTLIIAGPQDYDPGALFDVLGGTMVLETDAGSQGADLSISVLDAELYFGCNQHLDTLTIGDDGLARFAGANTVVVKHLVMDNVDLGAMTLTPEPATLALLAAGLGAIIVRKRRF